MVLRVALFKTNEHSKTYYYLISQQLIIHTYFKAKGITKESEVNSY